MNAFTESVVEETALEWFAALGYAVVAGSAIAPGEPGTERRASPTSSWKGGCVRSPSPARRFERAATFL